jgi:antitoxin (DNA-binding transcriptional repressor) of toxin-antitoxin stability system
MPSVNIRQLRDTRQLKAWLQAGKTVELRERDRVIGRIVPENSAAESNMWPDFRSRTAKVFGERVLPGADLLIKERGRY